MVTNWNTWRKENLSSGQYKIKTSQSPKIQINFWQLPVTVAQLWQETTPIQYSLFHFKYSYGRPNSYGKPAFN